MTKISIISVFKAKDVLNFEYSKIGLQEDIDQCCSRKKIEGIR